MRHNLKVIRGEEPISADAILSRYITRAATSPSAIQQNAYGRFISTLVEANMWRLFDVLYLLGASDQTLAKQNMVNTRHPLTEVNAPTWAADRGYTFNGTSQECTSTYNPSIHAERAQRTHDHISCYSLTASVNTGYDWGSTTGTLLGVKCRTGITAAMRINAASGQAPTVGIGAAPIHITGSRLSHNIAALTHMFFSNGILDSNASASSVAFENGTLGFGRAISLYCDRQIFMGSYGAGMNATEALIYYNACHAMAIAVGAAT